MNKFLASILFFLVSICLFAQKDGIPDPPNPPKYVNNLSKEFPDFLSESEISDLEEKISNFNQETSNSIVVVIVDDLSGFEPWEFAAKLGDKWKVGQEKEDNGIVILIKPTGGKGERKTFISTGRGLNGAIPDLTAQEIVDNELLPYFKNQEFFKGIDASLNVLMELAKGEYNFKDYKKKHENGSSGFIIVIVIIIIIVLLIKFGPKGGPGSRGGGSGFTWGAAGFMSGFGSGSSSSGSSFGGFGGGSFDGGGAGGSW